MSGLEIFGAVVNAITALAIIVAIIQLTFHSRQMHRDFETLYVQRYWDLMDRRSDKFALSGEPDESDRRVIHGYFQLCEDELDLRRVGRITDSTWCEWSRWMSEQCGAPPYVDSLEQADESAWPALRKRLRAAGSFDPLERGWIWRRWRGL